MKLKEIIESIGAYHMVGALEDFEVKGIACNSKFTSDGFIFVAIKGNKENGHRFVQEAVNRGAKAVVVQSDQDITQGFQDKPLIIVKDTRQVLAKLAVKFYGNPSAKMKVVGITGTNGKTTVSYLIEAFLKKAGLIPGVIGTVNYRFRDKTMSSKNTTPGPVELQSMLAEMLHNSLTHVIMEVSSHALDQDRTGGISFHSAIFTNLTQDHLDYHQTMENYFQAKSKLFKSINSHSFGVINGDDEYGARLKGLTETEVITYAINNKADIFAKDIRSDITGTEFLLASREGETSFNSRLIGRHNVYNILASVSWGLREGLDLSLIKSAVAEFNCVPGRLEKIDSDKGFFVFVDYAHTEDALSNVIRALREVSSHRIIVVFGCGGERDKTKRPKMGYVVTELADYAIITNDNPRSEDPQEIINDIKKGIKKDNYCVIQDRYEAIKKSLSQAKSKDIVLLAGKGHEDYQILNDRTIHFDDREAVRECLTSASY